MQQKATKSSTKVAQTIVVTNDIILSSEKKIIENIPNPFCEKFKNATKSSKSSTIPFPSYFCNICNYTTERLNNFNKHLLTPKHQTKCSLKPSIQEYNTNNTNVYECICGYICKCRSALWRHKNKCEKESKTNNLIQDLVKETQELIKENQELKQMVIDISRKPNVINNNINSNNKTKFNLNFFLNDTCKDALNLTDFVSSIKLQLTDLENVGKNGYVSGISNIIVKNLNALEVNKRPVHCSDYKRDIMYIKDENKWEKENDEKEKLSKAIKKVSYKNVLQIQNWQKENPGCEYSNNKKNDEYLQIVNESMGAFTEEENIENINKIIKNVAKEVIIEKEI